MGSTVVSLALDRTIRAHQLSISRSKVLRCACKRLTLFNRWACCKRTIDDYSRLMLLLPGFTFVARTHTCLHTCMPSTAMILLDTVMTDDWWRWYRRWRWRWQWLCVHVIETNRWTARILLLGIRIERIVVDGPIRNNRNKMEIDFGLEIPKYPRSNCYARVSGVCVWCDAFSTVIDNKPR